MQKSGKQLNVYVMIFIFLLLPFTDITKPFQGVMLQAAKGEDDLYQIQQLSNADLLQQLIVVPKQVNDMHSLVEMVQRINKIDRPILQLLVAQGVKVRLFEGNLTDEPLLYYLKWHKPRGWTSDVTWEDVPGSGGNWLVSAKIGASSAGNGHGSLNLELHEIGHTVYNLLMTSSNYANEFSQVWNEDVHSLFPNNDYFHHYPSEYFAEAFAYYYFDEDSSEFIQKNANVTYEFFNSLNELNINEIEHNYY